MKKLIVILLSVILVLSLTGCGGSSPKTNTCGSCGRTYEAGDSAGNFKSIAKSGMCNRCLKNYYIMSEAVGK